MFKTSNKKVVSFLCQLTVIILILSMLVSCGGNTPSGGNKETLKPTNKKEDTDPDLPGTSFASYTDAKGELISVITDALGSETEYALHSLSLLDLALVDLALIPVSSFGLGQEAATAALEFLGAHGVEYSESGNTYSIKYTNEDGEEYEVKGEYDKAADALKCTALINGQVKLVMEYRKTSFGYVAQYQTTNDDDTYFIYRLALSGTDGAIGISSSTSSAPPPLSGNETIDFPKESEAWFAIKGDQFTGRTSDGEEFSFTYIPSEDDEE